MRYKFCLLLALSSIAISTSLAKNYGDLPIDYVLTFTAQTHDPSTGAVADVDSSGVPSYRIYEDETGTAILTGNMALLDDANTTGFYSEQVTLSAANGFENGKQYTIRVSALVGGVTGATSHTLSVSATRTKIGYLPNATAGAVGGVFIAGTNAPVTITGDGPALTLTSTGSNGHALALTGQGAGDGIEITSGAAGQGIDINSEGTAIDANSSGSHGMVVTGNADAVRLLGGTGEGIEIISDASDAILLNGIGDDLAFANQQSPDLLSMLGLATGNIDNQFDAIDTGIAELEITTTSGPTEQEFVPRNRTAELIPTRGSSLESRNTLELSTDDASLLYAADFGRDLGPNQRIASITSVAITTGTSGGITFDSATGTGVDRTLAKFKMTGVTAGAYTVTVKVVYDGEAGSRTGRISVRVVD